jgi:hypothetical protein
VDASPITRPITLLSVASVMQVPEQVIVGATPFGTGNALPATGA